MQQILIIGAGRSSVSLIKYLLKQASVYDWQITVADMDLKLATEKVNGDPRGAALSFDIKDETARRNLISKHDLIISMLPAFMHGDVATDCLELGKHMATASYVSQHMQSLHAEAQKKGLFFLNECGLDPGLDHASAMKILDHIKSKGGVVRSFKSYCGGLVAPESNNNPWGYKFSWNPRNVVLAGQGTAQYLNNGKLKFIPYNRLFEQTETIEVEGAGVFDAYANRDSISYRHIYNLTEVQTMIRGTLRQQGYCRAWNVFVKLGLTDDTSKIANADRLSYGELLSSFLPQGQGKLKERVAAFAGALWNAEVEEKFDYLEILTDKPIILKNGSPAEILQALLEEKWKLSETDKDMIVMQHLFEYEIPGEPITHTLKSSLVVTGADSRHTAMARTVGLPLAITVKNFLTGKISLSGVCIPVEKEIYSLLLSEIEQYGIKFIES